MTEGDQGKNLPAVPDKIIVAPITNDASLLAKAGFTDRLPVAMKDLNNVLGRTDWGARLHNDPAVLSYVLETNIESPTLSRKVEYESGPKIILQVFPNEDVYFWDSTGKYLASPRVVLEIGEGNGQDRSITSAFLADLQDFVRKVFPNRKAMLHVNYREKVEGEEDVDGSLKTKIYFVPKTLELDLYSLTEEQVNELPVYVRGSLDKPYEITIESSNGSNLFLTVGLNLLHFYRGERVTDVDTEQQKRVFNLYHMGYDSKVFIGTGVDVERMLEAFRQLAIKNPYLHQSTHQEDMLKKELQL